MSSPGLVAEPRTDLSYYWLRRTVCASSPALAWVGVGMPFDVVRVRLQATTRESFRGTWHCLSATVQKEGLRALWQGSVPQLLLSVPYSAIMFGVYRQLEPKQPALDANFQETKTFYRGVFEAGCISGVAVTLFQNPLDVWRTRLQTTIKLPHSSSPSARTEIHLTPSTAIPPASAPSRPPSRDMSTLGPLLKERRLLMRGMSMTIVRNIPGNGVYFVAFEGLKRTCEANKGFGLSPSMQQLLCGGLTGLAFHVPFYPTEVVRTRMMISNHGGVMHTVREIWQTMGVSGFYRGVGVVLFKSFPCTAMGFWSIHATEVMLGLK